MSTVPLTGTTTPRTTSTGVTASTLGAQTVTDQRSLNANYDMFLQLLTAQLRNQSPLDPMKTETFSQQLTQFSGVEQQIKTNSMLERLIATQATGFTNAALSMLGSDVVANTPVARLTQGSNAQTSWRLDLPSAATRATITVRDANGALVFQETKALEAGQQNYVWNGRDGNGNVRASGDYVLSVEAFDGQDRPVTPTISARGRVTAIDLSGEEPILTVGNARLRLSEVRQVSLPPT